MHGACAASSSAPKLPEVEVGKIPGSAEPALLAQDGLDVGRRKKDDGVTEDGQDGFLLSTWEETAFHRADLCSGEGDDVQISESAGTVALGGLPRDLGNERRPERVVAVARALEQVASGPGGEEAVVVTRLEKSFDLGFR